MPLMAVAAGGGCTPLVPVDSFNGAGLPSSVTDPNSWWTLGAPFATSFHIT